MLDLNLPDFDGLEVARRLCASEASPAILILTVHCEDPLIFSALESGILGYVLKDEALETLVSAVRAVAQGLDNQANAERLVLTRRTVQNHVSNINASWWSWPTGA